MFQNITKLSSLQKQIIIRTNFSLLLFGLLMGCASSDTVLKSQPSTFVPNSFTNGITATEKNKSMNLPDLDVNIVAFKANGYVVKSGSPENPALYLAADVSGVYLKEATFTAKKRNKLMDLFLNISDYNSRLFLSRMFAANAHAKFGSGVINDLFTAASGATAPYLAPASVALSATNLVTKSVMQEYTSSYLGTESLPAIENQIIASRLTAFGALQNKKTLPYSEYSVFALIDDINYYDSLSSLNSGINQLNLSSQNEVSNASLKTATITGTNGNSAPVVSNTAPLSAQMTALKNGAALK